VPIDAPERIPGAIRPTLAERTRWREPSRLLPLRWGNYTDRYLAGIVLIIGGGIQLEGSNTWTLPLLLIGTAANVTGWSILPSRGWRRMVALVPAVAQLWIMLTGPESMWTLTVPYICWLLVRHRPLRSYVTVVFPIACGVIIPQYFQEYSGMVLALTISMAVFVGSAWLARFIASVVPVSRIPSPAPSILR
jgi:hypothetical protein